jgi:DNA repair ATPase RecN
MPERAKQDPAYQAQLDQVAEKRKMCLEEATTRANNLLKRAREKRAELAANDPRGSYTQLADQVVQVATDLQGIVAQVHAVYDDPVLQDEQLRASTNRMVAMDQLLDVVLRMLRETERMPAPMAALAGP